MSELASGEQSCGRGGSPSRPPTITGSSASRSNRGPEISCMESLFVSVSYSVSDGCQSGRLGTPGERVYRKVPRVRIPPHPPVKTELLNNKSLALLEEL